jgi:hypothetical protein
MTLAAAASPIASACAVAAPPADSAYPDVASLRAAHAKAGIIAPNKTYRMMEWECHTPPEGTFDIDLDAALNAARDAGAESMMFYAQDHWGHAFYPSDVAVRHPHLPGDLLGREVAIARKLGMSAVCYFSLQFNNQAVLAHPDWGWVDQKGVQQNMRWLITCLDSPYRQYVLGMMDEIFSRYEIDELFLDIYGIQFYDFHSHNRNPFCFCRHTREAWDKEHPGDPYEPGFATSQGWAARYQWHQQRTMTDILDQVIAVARKRRPGTLISLNGGPESFPNDVMQKVGFIYAEPLTSATGISLGSILMRGWGRPDYQAGVFSQQGYQDTYPGALPRVKADALLLQNARVFIVGNAPVIGGLDGAGYSKRWFKVAKETWADVRQVDALLEGATPVLSAAMLYSESTRDELARRKMPRDFRRSVLGALETMTYSGRPVESIAEFRLTAELLARFETLVLPEVEVLSAAHAGLIADWVQQGGTLIASGGCGLMDENHSARGNFPLAEVFGADYVSEERKYAYDKNGKLKSGVVQTYLESTAGHPLAAMLAESTVGLPGSFLKLKLRAGAAEVMHYRLPLMVEDLDNYKWFNWGPPPPGREVAGAAVVHNRFGRGQCLYIGAPLFRENSERQFWIRRWIPEVMRQLNPKPVAELRFETLPEYMHGTFFWEKSRSYILVQILNAMELATNAQLAAVKCADIYLDPQRLKVTGARVVCPSIEELKLSSLPDGRTHIRIPSPGRYTALYLRLG